MLPVGERGACSLWLVALTPAAAYNTQKKPPKKHGIDAGRGRPPQEEKVWELPPLPLFFLGLISETGGRPTPTSGPSTGANGDTVEGVE